MLEQLESQIKQKNFDICFTFYTKINSKLIEDFNNKAIKVQNRNLKKFLHILRGGIFNYNSKSISIKDTDSFDYYIIY